jgi:transposase
MPRQQLTDQQWERIQPLLPKHPKKRGRPWADDRQVLEGILWVLRTGAAWADLPKEYPGYATCWRRLNLWADLGVLENIWRELLRDIDAKGLLDWEECFIDASFSPAKKGVSRSVLRARERARSGWWWSTVTAFQSASSWRARRLARELSASERSQLYESLATLAVAREQSLSD